jgi:hypothetical protein
VPSGILAIDAAIRCSVHFTGGVLGGKYPTSNIARSSSGSDRTACACATASACNCGSSAMLSA